jgi:hypothetical protein
MAIFKSEDEVRDAYQRRANEYIDVPEDASPMVQLQQRLIGEQRAAGLTTKTLDETYAGEIKRADGSILKLDAQGKPVLIPPGMDPKEFEKQQEQAARAQNTDLLGRVEGDKEGNANKQVSFFQQLLGDNLQQDNPEDDPQQQLEAWRAKGSNAVGLSGLFAQAKYDLGQTAQDIDIQRQEIERSENKGKSLQEIEQQQAQNTKMKHRAQYEASFGMEQHARLRAVQIAIKTGNQFDPDWLDAKEAQIMDTFHKLNNDTRYKREFALMMQSPEERSEKIVQKTQQKLNQLYAKYLPEQSPEEKEKELEEKLRDLEARGDKDRLEHEREQAHVKAILRDNLETSRTVDFALEQRQDALIRRQREISIAQRAIEWAQEGKTPAEIMRLESEYAAAQASKGIDISPITATMQRKVDHHSIQVEKLLDEVEQHHSQMKQKFIDKHQHVLIEHLDDRTKEVLGLTLPSADFSSPQQDLLQLPPTAKLYINDQTEQQQQNDNGVGCCCGCCC